VMPDARQEKNGGDAEDAPPVAAEEAASGG
jgi:hypothetical protein